VEAHDLGDERLTEHDHLPRRRPHGSGAVVEAHLAAVPMTDLTHLEALVGPLPKGREYEVMMGRGMGFVDPNATIYTSADAALAEAYAVIERLVRENKHRNDDGLDMFDELTNLTSQRDAALVSLKQADLAAAREHPEIHVRWDKDGWTNTRPVRLVAETDGYIDWPVTLKVARYQPEEEKQ
jgi:hypothetical protein